MKKMLYLSLLLTGILFAGGYNSKTCLFAAKKVPADMLVPTMVAKYISTPIKLDGHLDDLAWKDACV
jgi:hypothetical protein